MSSSLSCVFPEQCAALRRRGAVLAALSGLALSSSALAVGGPIVKVALTGETPSGGTTPWAVSLDGVSFTTAVINNQGQVAFGGRYVQGVSFGVNDRAIFQQTPNSSSVVEMFRGGSAGPVAGVTTRLNSTPIFGQSDAGYIGANARLAGTGVTVNNDTAIYEGDGPGALVLRAREGAPAPGLAAGINLGSINGSTIEFSPVLVTRSGLVSFQTALNGTGVNQTSDEAIYAGTVGAPVVVVRKNDAAAGIVNVRYAHLEGHTINDSGRVAFRSQLQGTVAQNNDQGIFSVGPGGNFLIAREGTAAPGAASAQFGGGGLGTTLGDPSINNAGLIAFRSPLMGSVSTTNNSGIWIANSASPTALGIVKRENDLAPGLTNIRFASFDDVEASDPVINNEGRLAAVVKLTGTGVVATNDTAVYSGFGLSQLVAREGDVVPGLAGVNFGIFNDGAQVAPSMNALGALVFKSALAGPAVSAMDDEALFGFDPNRGVCELVRKGDLIDVTGAGDMRQVSGLSIILGSGGEDGRVRSVNDLGDVAFIARFTDGSAGVFVTNIPAPGAGVLVLAAVLTAGRRRRA